MKSKKKLAGSALNKIRKVVSVNRFTTNRFGAGADRKMSQTLETFGMKMSVISPNRSRLPSSHNTTLNGFNFSLPITRAQSPKSTRNINFKPNTTV